jgi:predicted lipoprotein with Yx(FWY)xxD motif
MQAILPDDRRAARRSRAADPRRSEVGYELAVLLNRTGARRVALGMSLTRTLLILPGAGVALAVLAACGSSGGAGNGPNSDIVSAPPASSSSAITSPAGTSPAGSSSDSGDSGSAGGAALSVASTSLGSILVDGSGMAVYIYTPDQPNVSTCTGGCLAAWPAVPAPATLPTSLPGVTGTVGEITRTDDGTKQLTVDGMPIYTYVGDKAAGQTTGQGLDGIWYVLSPAGAEIKS